MNMREDMMDDDCDIEGFPLEQPSVTAAQAKNWANEMVLTYMKYWGNTVEPTKAFEVICEALDKQTPKLAHFVSVKFIDKDTDETVLDMSHFECPTCGNILDWTVTETHCGDCGQFIKGDDREEGN